MSRVYFDLGQEGLREEVTSLYNDKKVHREALNLVNRHSIMNFHCFFSLKPHSNFIIIFSFYKLGKLRSVGN